MYNGYTLNDSDPSRAPLIVVTEALPSEETAQDSTVKFLLRKKKDVFF